MDRNGAQSVPSSNPRKTVAVSSAPLNEQQDSYPASGRTSAPFALLKQTVAARLREEILSGRLAAGERVVEGKWAEELGVAQGSIREALHLLTHDGLVVKGAGRSARVIRLSAEDVRQIYDVRMGLESQSARLVTESRADLGELWDIVKRMEDCASGDDVPALIEQDLLFHLSLAKKTGNRLLAEYTRRLLTPLFAFVLLRVKRLGAGFAAWKPTLPVHRRILEVIELGDPAIAEQFMVRATRQFSANALEYWTDSDHGGRQT